MSCNFVFAHFQIVFDYIPPVHTSPLSVSILVVSRMDAWVIVVIIAIAVVLLLPTRSGYEPSAYTQMTLLPYATPPTGPGSLGEVEAEELKVMYPGERFSTGEIVPVSCKNDLTSGVRIYETGNALNPNTHSTWGVVTPNDIDW